MAAFTNLVGQNILGYHVDEIIGSGGFGTVYKVSKTNASGHYVSALKHIVIPSETQYYDVLHSMGGDHSKAENYFESVLQEIIDEITILQSLSGKNNNHIVTYYDNDVKKQDDPLRYDIFIRMEYLTPLSQYLKEHAFTVKDVIDLGIDILSAMELCHSNGIIHRDIKDDNIFVNQDHVFKIGDFGVAKLLKDSSRAASMKGTPAFIAPEILALKEYDHTVDIYSLGIVLYKLLNYSRLPFLPPFPESYEMKDIDLAIEKRQKGEIPERPFHAPAVLGDCIVKACSPREQRYSSAMEFSKALMEVKQSLSNEELSKVVLEPNANRNSMESSTYFTTRNRTFAQQANHQSFDETIGTDYSNTNNRRDEEEKKANSPPSENPFETVASPKAKELTYDEPPTPETRKALEQPISQPRIPPASPLSVKKDLSLFIYLAPVIIILIAIIYYMNIFSFLGEFPLVGKIIGRSVISSILFISFIVSLFLVGKQLHGRKKDPSPSAELKDKEVYYKALEIQSSLKSIFAEEHEASYKQVRNKMNQLIEQLKIEQDFGYGNHDVIFLENEIASILYHIKGLIDGYKKRNMGQLLEIPHLIQEINELLHRRREMLKR